MHEGWHPEQLERLLKPDDVSKSCSRGRQRKQEDEMLTMMISMISMMITWRRESEKGSPCLAPQLLSGSLALEDDENASPHLDLRAHLLCPLRTCI